MTKRHDNRRPNSPPDVEAILQFPPEVVSRSSPPEPAAPITTVSPATSFAPVASVSKTAAFATLPQRSAPLRRKERPLIWLAVALGVCVTMVWAATRYRDRRAAPRQTRSSQPSPVKARPLELIEAPVMPSPVARVSEPPPPPPPLPAEPRRERPREQAPAQARSAPKVAAAVPAAVPDVSAAAFYGALAVESEPAGAQVFVNGQPVGSTPLTLPEIPAGSRVVRIVADGYAPWSSAIRIVANQQTHVAATLKRW